MTAPDKIREILLEGFVLGERLCPWGVTMHEASVISGLTEDKLGGLRSSSCRDIAGLAVCDVTASGPGLASPIVTVSYSVLADVASLNGLERLVTWMSEGLGEPKDEVHDLLPGCGASGQVRRTLKWPVGKVDVTLSVFGGARPSSKGPVGCGLYLHHDERVLVQPYLGAFDAKAADWHAPGGDLECFRVAGLRLLSGHGPLSSAEQLALYYPHLKRAPGWIAERLRENDVALWSHPSGWRGIASPEGIWPSRSERPALRLDRYLPAKGSGFAVLQTAEGQAIARSEPGATGFDKLAAALDRSGFSVEVLDGSDW